MQASCNRDTLINKHKSIKDVHEKRNLTNSPTLQSFHMFNWKCSKSQLHCQLCPVWFCYSDSKSEMLFACSVLDTDTDLKANSIYTHPSSPGAEACPSDLGVARWASSEKSTWPVSMTGANGSAKACSHICIHTLQIWQTSDSTQLSIMGGAIYNSKCLLIGIPLFGVKCNHVTLY